MHVSVLLIPTDVQNTGRLAFLPLPEVCRSCATGLPNMIVLMSVWNPPASIGFRYLIFLRRITSGLLFLIPNIQNLKKVTKLIVRMPSGFAIYTNAVW